MLKGIFKNRNAILWVVVLVFLLACVRLFEKTLFYDPFLLFFKGNYQDKPLPDFQNMKLFFGILFRYTLNTILSLAIIYVVFKDVALVKFSLLLYTCFFVLLTISYLGILNFSDKPDYMLLFYVRRFLIQPLLLVLFLPAFYYQKKVS